MSISYTYPRVDVVTTALQRQTYNETIDDTLVMFAPFKSSMGPMDEIKRIHSLGEFEATYGTTDYSVMGHTGLNIRNWLNNGGTVYAMRHDSLTDFTSVTLTNHPATHAYGGIIGGRYALNIDMVALLSKLRNSFTSGDDKELCSKLISILPLRTNVNINGTANDNDGHLRIGASGCMIFLNSDGNNPFKSITVDANSAKTIRVNGGNNYTNIVSSGGKINLTNLLSILQNNTFISITDLKTGKIYSGSKIDNNIVLDTFELESDGTPKYKESNGEFATFYSGIEFGTNELGQYRYYGASRCNASGTDLGAEETAARRLRLVSKNAGSGYNNFTVSAKVRRVDNSGEALEYIVNVYNGGSLVERFYVTKDNCIELFNPDNAISEYIYFGRNDVYADNQIGNGIPLGDTRKNYGTAENAFRLLSSISYSTISSGGRLRLSNGEDTTATDNDVVKDVFETTDNAILNQLRNTLEYPIDFVIDAAYSMDVKTAIYKAFCSEATDPNFLRNDINVLLDAFAIETDGTYVDHQTEVDSLIDTNNTRNLSVYSQLVRTHNPFNPTEVIAVAPSYYLTQLIPNNAIQQQRGTHEPIAGLNRGVLTDVVSVNESPLPEKKEEYFQNRTNYIETDRYQSAFMSQRTREKREDNTALQFLNNSITTNRMVKELSKLARVYLFEYNDAVTLSNLRNVLNKYISEFVANRTLSYAMVDVQKNPYSEEAIDVTLNIKFTGTIEVISVALTIE